MKKQFIKPEIKGVRLRENILAGSGQDVAKLHCIPEAIACPTNLQCGGQNIAETPKPAARERLSF